MPSEQIEPAVCGRCRQSWLLSRSWFSSQYFWPIRFYGPEYFTIERIYIEGSQYRVDSRTIEQSAWRSVHGNYFSVNLNAIEERLKEIPGVYAVTVRRVWPGALRISITESEGLAKWSELRPDASPSTKRFVNLPPGRVLSQIPELSGPAKQRRQCSTCISRLIEGCGRWAWR